MIQDQIVLEGLRAEWKAIEDFLETIRCSWVEVETPAFQFEPSRDLAFLAANMCVVFALGLLERVLRQLKDEKVIRTDGCTLSHLMTASQMAGLSWKDYDLIDRIRIKRNEIAHKQLRLSEEECGKIVRAISDELQCWSIITR